MTERFCYVAGYDPRKAVTASAEVRLSHDAFHAAAAVLQSVRQFAGSSSVPAHVEMMGFLGAGNNPMVGMTVSVAVAVEESLKK